MKKKMLVISSGGGHWIQALRLLPALQGNDLYFSSVNESYRSSVSEYPYFVVTDANMWTKWKMLKTIYDVFFLIKKLKPDFVLSTGAAPGLWGIVIGRIYGARTIWIDSIANVEDLSLSGKIARRFSCLFLTQWEHIALKTNTLYKGKVI